MNTLKRLLRKIPCVFGIHTWKLIGAPDVEDLDVSPAAWDIRICCPYCGKNP